MTECHFEKNGKKIYSNSRIGGRTEERLQALLGKSNINNNWDGLLEEIYKECNDEEIIIKYKGRKIDFDDLEYSLQQYKGNARFRLVLSDTRNDNDIIKELDKIFDNIKRKKLPQFAEKDKSGSTVFEKYERVKNGILDVNVIATVSSGKSTLINALLHTDLLPVRNEATTATIGSILDNDKKDRFEAECYGKDGIVYSRRPVNAKILEEYNQDERVREINIEGNIPAIPSDKMRLRLNDTPGPNNSRNLNHGKLTYDIIKNRNSVTIYVMNATQQGINDDKELLLDISSEMKKAGKQSRDRFIFVINKCDTLDEEKKESVEQTMKKTVDYLRNEFDIINPILIPTSARIALLIYKEQKGEILTRNERRDFYVKEDFLTESLLHFEKYACVTSTIREELEKKLKKIMQTKKCGIWRYLYIQGYR